MVFKYKKTGKNWKKIIIAHKLHKNIINKIYNKEEGNEV